MPSRSLDSRLRFCVPCEGNNFSILTDFREKGKTVIFTTHDPEEAAEYADEVILLEKGKVRVKGTIADVYNCNPSFMT